MKTWFCNYDGGWSQELAHVNRTKPFADIVRMVRGYFDLQKTKTPGVEISKLSRGRGKVIRYPDIGATVEVTAFEWHRFARNGHSWQPKLRLKFVMKNGRKTIYDTWLEILFEDPWPKRPPRVRLLEDKYKNFDGNAHAHHMYDNGWLCFYADSDDWDDRQTIISFINATFNWMNWHHTTYGW